MRDPAVERYAAYKAGWSAQMIARWPLLLGITIAIALISLALSALG